LPHNLHVLATTCRRPARSRPGSGPGTQLLEAAFEVGDPGGQAEDVGPLPVPVRPGPAPAAGPVAAAGVARRFAGPVGDSPRTGPGPGLGPAGVAGQRRPGGVALRATPPEASAALLGERGRMTA